MFSLFKKNLVKSGVLTGMVDAHTHSLWGVDDGSKSEDETRKMLTVWQEMGVSTVWSTPHIMSQVHRNKEEDYQEKFAERIAPLAAEYGVDIHLAAEYMMDTYLREKLKAGEDLLCFPHRHILLEMPMVAPVLDREQYFYELDVQGYGVVLAHVERYPYLDDEELMSLKDSGTLFQLNLLSLGGFYGKSTMLRAFDVLERGLYDLIGSDAHNAAMLSKVKQLKLSSKHLRMMRELAERNIDFFTAEEIN